MRRKQHRVRFIWFKDKPIGGIVAKTILKRCFLEWTREETRHSKGYWILKSVNGNEIDDDTCKSCYPTFREFVKKYRRWVIFGLDEPCGAFETGVGIDE